jgi:primosomal protein N' (replication factor Y)
VAARQDPRPTIAEVAFNLPLEKSFHYLIPPALEGTVEPGRRVAAPFGPRERIGFVLRLVAESPVTFLKPIRRVIDPQPVIAEERWALAAWLSDYSYCSMGEALAAMVPSALRLRPVPAPVPGSSAPVTDSIGAEVPGTGAVTLTVHQRRALKAIVEALESRRSERFLLYGVTGSGKTELYLRAIDHALRQGRSAICLIPEIALTPQTTDRFLERFGARVAVWHSRLGARQRSGDWVWMAQGECRIVVGARSAVFAPVHDLGLVVIWDDGDDLHAEPRAPYPHSREVLLTRAGQQDTAVLVGGFARTPEADLLVTTGWARELAVPREGLRRRARVDVVESADRGVGTRLPHAAREAVREGLRSGPVLVPEHTSLYYYRLVPATPGCGSTRGRA